MRYKFADFKNCLFCFKELPPLEERVGEGEHIIPKNIFGFWTSKDICNECKIFFGKAIDIIPVKNIRIIDAIKSLKIKTSVNFSEGLKYEATDKFTKEKVQMFRKDEKLKVKSKLTEDRILSLDEKDIRGFGLKHVIENRKDLLPEEEIIEEFEKLSEKYLDLEHGETIRSEKLKMFMRRGLLEGAELDISSTKLMSPLIAKIIIFLIYYFLPEDSNKIHNINDFREHARYEKPIEDWLISWDPPPTLKYDQYHAVELEFSEKVCIVDVRLFRSANWRTYLFHDDVLKSKFVLDENGNTIEFERIGLVLDFENEKNKKLYWKYQEKGKEETEYIQIN